MLDWKRKEDIAKGGLVVQMEEPHHNAAVEVKSAGSHHRQLPEERCRGGRRTVVGVVPLMLRAMIRNLAWP